MICRKCHSLSVENGVCSDCGAISEAPSKHSVEDTEKNEDGFPRQTREWRTPNVTTVDVFNLGASLFVLLWVAAFIGGTTSSWVEKALSALVGLGVILFCLYAVVGPARITIISPDGSVTFERQQFRPKSLTVERGELSSITGSLMDINRFRPMTVRKGEASIAYIPPRDDAIEVFRMIIKANPRAWVSNPTAILNREKL